LKHAQINAGNLVYAFFELQNAVAFIFRKYLDDDIHILGLLFFRVKEKIIVVIHGPIFSV
jgi:hypothetical protein